MTGLLLSTILLAQVPVVVEVQPGTVDAQSVVVLPTTTQVVAPVTSVMVGIPPIYRYGTPIRNYNMFETVQMYGNYGYAANVYAPMPYFGSSIRVRRGLLGRYNMIVRP
jgi:hypothetical protein